MRTFTILALIAVVSGALTSASTAGESAPLPSDEPVVHHRGGRSEEIQARIGFSQPPVLKRLVQPQNPTSILASRMGERVLVRVTVGVDGRVVEAALIDSRITGLKATAALEAARQCEFEPARISNKPVEAPVVIPFYFHVEVPIKYPRRCSCRHEEISIQLSPEDIARIMEPKPERGPSFAYRLDANYPNPFNPSTVIPYEIASPSRVRLHVYNVRGQLVRVLVDEQKSAGSYRVRWNGRSANGAPVASGVYFYRITAGHFMQSRKMLLLK